MKNQRILKNVDGRLYYSPSIGKKRFYRNFKMNRRSRFSV
ncbi:hypothetical protein CHCC15381_3949 [Bacillus paralicheniformis]|uniref:DUF4102 domain-containing protein n=1 Tax=Bacillus paralicheniformis TaxID=1648923 RepID=A0ABY3FZ27_9BACI|nr:hypothetical protein CHCC15381_3949 [Bacillus paralicheniformis]